CRGDRKTAKARYDWFECAAGATPPRSPPKSGPAARQPQPISAPHVSPVEKRSLRVASARRSCSRASAATTSLRNSRSPRNDPPLHVETHPSRQLRSPAPAGPWNRTSASLASVEEDQCAKNRSSITS